MKDIPEKLLSKLTLRERQNALRRLPSLSSKVDFSSNDYLGFSKDSLLFGKAETLLREKGLLHNGATGSRLISGNHRLFETLEQMIAAFHEAESALVFNSGYDANLGFFSSVPQRGDIVFYDEFAHASIRDGLKLGNAKSYKFKHNDLDDLKSKCQAERSRSPKDAVIYIVTESVFSMDGDSPDLEAFANFSAENDCNLILDEAHAIGVFGTKGTGLVQQLGLEKKVFARIITYGKALGCHGAAILGSANLICYLVNFARSFVYTTGLPPHSVATILAAYETLVSLKGAQKRKQLQKNIEHFTRELLTLDLDRFFISSRSAIQCCMVSGNDKVKSMANQLQESGFDVRPILSPTVPKDQERLRFCIHADNSAEDISKVLGHLSKLIILS